MKNIIYTFFVLMLLSACSTKKSTLATRTYHRITSWYNTIFNGNEELKKYEENKRSIYKDNFSHILEVEPINPFTTSNTSDESSSSTEGRKISDVKNELSDNFKNLDVKGAIDNVKGAVNDFLSGEAPSQLEGLDKSIEKGRKVIGKHSILIKGKEYNSMLAEAYLLLAKSYYYKRDPFESLNYLNYMNSTLVKNRRKNEAQIYMALAQYQSENSFEADQIFEELLKEKKMRKRDKKLLTKSYSQFLIDEKRYEEAISSLDQAKKYNKGKYNYGRYSFIQAQLLEKLGKKEEAIASYQNTFDKKPSPEFEVKSQIALSRLFTGDTLDYEKRIKLLDKLAKKGLYKSRRNELFYAMALTSFNVNKQMQGLAYLKESLKEKESDPQIRALVYREVGDYYFKKPDYLYAAAYYDSAISNFIDPGMKASLKAKAASLKELTEKYYFIKRSDSILLVANMSVNERNEYFQKYINKLKEQEEKEKQELEKKMREENDTTFSTEDITSESNPIFTSLSTPTSGKWYFYNNSVKQNGMTEFKRLWGDRALVDNWRESTKSTGLEDIRSQLLGQETTKNPRRFEVAYYTEKLPQPSELEKLKQKRDSAELYLGVLYYDKILDPKSATTTLEHLLSTPPFDKDLSLVAMYNLYKINKESNPVLAKKYADLILGNYPNSRYAEVILNPQRDIAQTKSSEAVLYYQQVYKKYEEGDYNEVKRMIDEATKKYSNDEIIAKFNLLEAFNEARLGNKEEFMKDLERVAISFDKQEEGKKARELLNYFKSKEKINNIQDNNKFDQKNNSSMPLQQGMMRDIDNYEANDSMLRKQQMQRERNDHEANPNLLENQKQRDIMNKDDYYSREMERRRELEMERRKEELKKREPRIQGK